MKPMKGSIARMEKIPETEFDACFEELAEGWVEVARKGGYVYIARRPAAEFVVQPEEEGEA